MSWSREQTSMLLDLYRDEPLLWQIKHPLYYNKIARKETLEDIARMLEKIRPNTSVELIKIKLNTLRTQFTKELGNYRKAAKNPNALPCKITLWCFEKMLFLQDYITSKKSWTKPGYLQNNYCNEQTLSYTGEDPLEVDSHTDSKDWVTTLDSLKNESAGTSYQNSTDWIQMQHIESTNTTQSSDIINLSSSVSECSDTYMNTRTKKRRTGASVDDDVPSEEAKQPTTTLRTRAEPQATSDEWDLLGTFVANEIKNLKSDTRRKKLKRQIIQVIFKYQEEEEEEEQFNS